MLKISRLLILFTTTLILVTGCQSTANKQVEIKMKSKEEQMKRLDTYTYDDYKKVFDKAVSEANRLEEDDEQLKKWIIRTLAQEKLYFETDLTDKQVIEKSKQAMEKDKVWKDIAKKRYSITVSEEEVNHFIEEGPDTSELPEHRAFANALGLSIEELNHTFDRDIYVKNAMWLKLKPKLEKKYNATDNSTQLEKYEEEVESMLNR
ncbi:MULTISPECIES: hypothetical protein [Pontibacillus]|uniref:SurA-like protein n=1 Tax=Pontibacillus chungwhensis TaxID=265426 RepID=A0ABY8V620_9BACI|nr:MULTISPECIES: hypothetical protein [Pontibacillus]MCD5324408.1 hypothetical protein [Pontibacillus sp. HN14]WIF99296.1 hypothetical protein QNI29_06450 [Pontibacillus chungwhensis]